jgi:sugar phosphate isomerase/epimerase
MADHWILKTDLGKVTHLEQPMQKMKMSKRVVAVAAAALFVIFHVPPTLAEPMHCIEAAPAGSLWAHDNLHVWEVANGDLKKRGPDERARMLKRWGIKHYAYLSRQDPYGVESDINTSQLDIDAEIEAMQRNGIDIRAWYFWVNTDDPGNDPNVTKTFEAFKRHNIHPQVWVPQSFVQGEMSISPKTPEEQEQRVNREAERIRRLVKLAVPYGLKVNLYNHSDDHGSWLDNEENELAILERLKEVGVSNVGLVFNFGHAMGAYPNLLQVFPQIWERIKPYVVAVNVNVNPYFLGMMRIVDESGWKGPIGIWAGGGDAELDLRYELAGLDWLATELRHRVAPRGSTISDN